MTHDSIFGDGREIALANDCTCHCHVAGYCGCWMRDWNPQYKADWNAGYDAQVHGDDYSQLHTQGWKDGWVAAQEDGS